MFHPRRFAILVLLALTPPVEGGDPPRPVVPTPAVALESDAVAGAGDAADDPAIWVHPGDPARSLVLGTDKKGGLNVFDMDGRRLQVASPGSMPNNVDVLYGFPLGDRRGDLALAGTRGAGKYGITAWRVDPSTRSLAEVGPVPAFAVLGDGEPYGSCAYRSPHDGAGYVFVTSKDGVVEQYRITADDARAVRGTLVRRSRVGSQVEGCVADLDFGHLYVGEKDVGTWKYAAETDRGTNRTLGARVGEHGLAADIEGLTIYYGRAGTGYLIASCQGNNTYAAFERAGANAFVSAIAPRGGAIAPPAETDGIDVTSAPTSPRFRNGLFVAQEGKPRGGRQAFKFFAWDDLAADHLRVEPTPPAR